MESDKIQPIQILFILILVIITLFVSIKAGSFVYNTFKDGISPPSCIEWKTGYWSNGWNISYHGEDLDDARKMTEDELFYATRCIKHN